MVQPPASSAARAAALKPEAAAVGARPLREQPPIRLLAGTRNLVLVLVDVQPLELEGTLDYAIRSSGTEFVAALAAQLSHVPGDSARRSSARSCGGRAGSRCTKCQTALSGRTSTQECQMALPPGTPTGRARPFAEITSLRVPMRRP